MSRFRTLGFDGLRDRRVDNGVDKVDADYREALRVLLYSRPTDSGWARPTWTRELIALEMERRGFPRISVGAVGRALSHISARRGNPKPFVLRPWPHRRKRRVLNILLRLCGGYTDKEPVFHADEVDLHFNPKIGLDWMNRAISARYSRRGKQEALPGGSAPRRVRADHVGRGTQEEQRALLRAARCARR